MSSFIELRLCSHGVPYSSLQVETGLSENDGGDFCQMLQSVTRCIHISRYFIFVETNDVLEVWLQGHRKTAVSVQETLWTQVTKTEEDAASSGTDDENRTNKVKTYTKDF
jgi:hypothetical protein